jgi:transcriptional regulator of aromatic amino acid metabolism
MMSIQLDNISRQLQDRSIARKLQSIGIAMRDLTLRRVKPLMKLRDDLVYCLAILELQVQPLWRQVNQSISHLRTIQYYIDRKGDKIAQLVSAMTLRQAIANYKNYENPVHTARSQMYCWMCTEQKLLLGGFY